MKTTRKTAQALLTTTENANAVKNDHQHQGVKLPSVATGRLRIMTTTHSMNAVQSGSRAASGVNRLERRIAIATRPTKAQIPAAKASAYGAANTPLSRSL